MASFDRAVSMQPGFERAHFHRANTLQALKRYDEALASFDRVLALRPDFAEAFSNRGNILQLLKRFDDTLASYDRAIALQPGFALAHYNRGNVLQDLNRFDDALTSYDRALALRPDFAEAFSNRGAALQELKRHEEALASYEGAINILPDYADAHFNKALCMLVLGDFDRGWEVHEWRWQTEQLRASRHNFTQPLWLGKTDIAGKTILLHSEQGFGDTIQFCRYVPMVAARGACVILEVQEPVRRLMNGLASATKVIARDDPLPEFDTYCPLLSMPLAFGTRLETIPAAVPYLRAASQDTAVWDARLGPRTRPRIGIAWSGLPTHKNDHNRSIRLSALLPLLDADAAFVSLHKDVRADDAEVLKQKSDLLFFGDDIGDFPTPPR